MMMMMMMMGERLGKKRQRVRKREEQEVAKVILETEKKILSGLVGDLPNSKVFKLEWFEDGGFARRLEEFVRLGKLRFGGG